MPSDEDESGQLRDIPIPDGPGPFALPAFARFLDLQSREDLGFAIARFSLEDGALVHVPIHSLAAEQLINALGDWLRFRDQIAAAKNSPLQ